MLPMIRECIVGRRWGYPARIISQIPSVQSEADAYSMFLFIVLACVVMFCPPVGVLAFENIRRL